MKVKELLRDKAQKHKDKPAVIFKEGAITFSALYEGVKGLAYALGEKGVHKGDKVAIFLPNCPQYIVSYLSLFSIGAVVVPLDFMLTENELINFIGHSDASVLIARPKKDVNFQAIRASCPQLQKLILLEDDETSFSQDSSVLSLNALLADRHEPVLTEIKDCDPAAIFYTSGSTGHPKGVLLNYGHLDNPVRCIKDFLDVKDTDSYLCAGVPFSHIGGLDYMIFMLAFGSTLVLMDRFHPLESLKNIEKHKVTIFCIVPSMFVAILSLKACDRYDLSSLRYAVVFGAPSSPALLKRFHTNSAPTPVF